MPESQVIPKRQTNHPVRNKGTEHRDARFAGSAECAGGYGLQSIEQLKSRGHEEQHHANPHHMRIGRENTISRGANTSTSAARLMNPAPIEIAAHPACPAAT